MHTPGPWHIVEDRTPTSLEVFAGKMAIAELWRRLDRHTEMANAKLIAAAPDLLESLQEMVAMMDKGDEYGAGSPWHAKAKAAIAKAS